MSKFWLVMEKTISTGLEIDGEMISGGLKYGSPYTEQIAALEKEGYHISSARVFPI